MEQIKVKNLYKQFVYNKKTSGKLFSKTKKQEVEAVKNINFEVNKGETLAFIGPNGAGKSTTIKMLTGILYPTSGKAKVLGVTPWEERQKLAFKIGTVFGQRSQLSFHLPPKESFDMFAKIYEIEEEEYRKRLNRLIELFKIEKFLDQPLRKLSLGQRMRCEVLASLIHSPEIIFLDEPTIGLDVVAKRELRDILKDLNRDLETTIFLTSHDTSDIEALCDRTVVINNGEIVFDNNTKELKNQYIKEKNIYIRFEQDTEFELSNGIELLGKTNLDVKLNVNLEKTTIKNVLEEITSKYDIIDINIEDPTLESIIANIYENGIE